MDAEHAQNAFRLEAAGIRSFGEVLAAVAEAGMGDLRQVREVHSHSWGGVRASAADHRGELGLSLAAGVGRSHWAVLRSQEADVHTAEHAGLEEHRIRVTAPCHS